MSDREEAREMLAVAERDLRTLRALLSAEDAPDESIGQFAQAVIEKSLKAWICELGIIYPLTHSLKHLVAILDAEGQPVSDLADLDFLTPFAMEARYALGGFGHLVADRPAILARVEAVFDRASARIAEGDIE